VALVVHADPPVEHKAYLHRSGRTARAGAAGTVITLMTDEQVRDVRALTRAAGIKPTTTRVDGPRHPVLATLAPGERVTVAGGLVVAAPAPAPRQSATGSEGSAARRRPRRRSGGQGQGSGQGSSQGSGQGRAQDRTQARGQGRPQGAKQGPKQGSQQGPKGGGQRSGGPRGGSAGSSSHSAASFSSGRR